MTRLERLAVRVRRASTDLETNEYPSNTGPYFTLARWSCRATLPERIDLATEVYLHGNSALRGSRAYDNCFEMGDGRAVSAELTRRAKTDPILHAAISQDFGGAFPAHWLRHTQEPELAV